MKKLLLTSAAFVNPKIVQEFLRLVNKEPNQIKVLFIPTAAISDGALRYVKSSKKELEHLGIQSKNILEFNCDKNSDNTKLKEIDVIYVCGGNTFYLLHKIRESGFDKKIIKMVNKGKVFVGVSAGSILAGPNIDIASPFDKNDVGLKDLSALNLTDIIVSPHYVDEEKKIIDEFRKKYSNKIMPLTNEQALLIEGDKIKLI